MGDTNIQPSPRVALLTAGVFLSAVGTGVVFIFTERSPHHPWPFVGMIAMTTVVALVLFRTPKGKQFVRVAKRPLSKWQRIALAALGAVMFSIGAVLITLYLPSLIHAWQHNEAKRFFDYFKKLFLPIWLVALGISFAIRGLKRGKADLSPPG